MKSELEDTNASQMSKDSTSGTEEGDKRRFTLGDEM